MKNVVLFSRRFVEKNKVSFFLLVFLCVGMYGRSVYALFAQDAPVKIDDSPVKIEEIAKKEGPVESDKKKKKKSFRADFNKLKQEVKGLQTQMRKMVKQEVQRQLQLRKQGKRGGAKVVGKKARPIKSRIIKKKTGRKRRKKKGKVTGEKKKEVKEAGEAGKEIKPDVPK